TVFRPPRTVPRPRTRGPQTAVVTGPRGQDIWTDQYGRVKLKFHWDRSPVRDQNSSCWVRVSYAWAGNGFGGIHIPRVGSEVIVDFENGDPDRPIVTGRVYNALHMPPWALPDNATQSGFLTRSVKEGSQVNANAIRFEDRRGQEEVWIHAERDLRIDVENNETVQINQNRTEKIGVSETVTIGGTYSQTVGLTSNVMVGASYTLSVMGAMAVTAGLESNESVGLSKTTSVGNAYTIDAGDRFELKVGEASIVLEKSGDINIRGKSVTISGSDGVQVQGKTIDLN
ncbi:type VI secretion system Vgr family protein, partial [Burkholderia ubonensis]|uniref:type VI secretion system Vgr family protein n=1 Tax=Burkholderia ubonensis TaxID=101571 RepID=UPI000A4562A0